MPSNGPQPSSILRANVSQVGFTGSTFITKAVHTPVDPRQNVAMLLKRVQLQPNVPFVDTIVGSDWSFLQGVVSLSTRNEPSAINGQSVAGTLAYAQYTIHWSQASGPGGLSHSHYGYDSKFADPGILVADAQLSLSMDQFGDVGAFNAWDLMIEYELVQVSSQEFFAALSLLETLS